MESKSNSREHEERSANAKENYSRSSSSSGSSSSSDVKFPRDDFVGEEAISSTPAASAALFQGGNSADDAIENSGDVAIGGGEGAGGGGGGASSSGDAGIGEVNVGQMKAVVYVKITPEQIEQINNAKALYDSTKAALGSSHLSVLNLIYKLGELYFGTYQWSEAESCYRQAWLGKSSLACIHLFTKVACMHESANIY